MNFYIKKITEENEELTKQAERAVNEKDELRSKVFKLNYYLTKYFDFIFNNNTFFCSVFLFIFYLLKNKLI